VLVDSVVKSCKTLKQLDIKSEDRVALLTRRSRRAAKLSQHLLARSNNVVLVADSTIFDGLREEMAAEEPPALQFLDIQQCRVKEWLPKFEIQQLHIFFDEFDFAPVDSSSNLAGLLSCLVKTFEAFPKDARLYLHMSRSRSMPTYKRVRGLQINSAAGNQSEVVHTAKDSYQVSGELAAQVREPHVPTNHRINSCDPLYDYDYFQDVFMKSVSIYTKAYSNLYHFSVQYVVH
jgi:hypothetical protein